MRQSRSLPALTGYEPNLEVSPIQAVPGRDVPPLPLSLPRQRPVVHAISSRSLSVPRSRSPPAPAPPVPGALQLPDQPDWLVQHRLQLDDTHRARHAAGQSRAKYQLEVQQFQMQLQMQITDRDLEQELRQWQVNLENSYREQAQAQCMEF